MIHMGQLPSKLPKALKFDIFQHKYNINGKVILVYTAEFNSDCCIRKKIQKSIDYDQRADCAQYFEVINF